MEFLKTSGKIIVNESGEEILLKGYGAGSWLNVEGFLFGTGGFHAGLGGFSRMGGMDRGRSIDQIMRETCGSTYTDKFWHKWYRTYFSDADIKNLHECGFNSVRLALNARLFLKEEPGYIYDEEMFEYLDQVIDWCEENNIYVILDMHAAVGPQSAIPCDDGQDNYPHLFFDEESYERNVVLWGKIAERYADRAVVAGYELLNEPVSLPAWNHLLPELMSFYRDCIAKIRSVDKNHIIFIEGHRFASRWDTIVPDMDPECGNWVLAVHMYEQMPDLSYVGPLLEAREKLGVPVWLGETGGYNGWMSTLLEMLYENHVGVNVWCHKGAETADASCLLTFKVPEGMKLIEDYATKGAKKPSYEKSISIFDEMLENVKFENCVLRTDRVNAILRKPSVVIPAIGYDMLPGEGESFHGTYKYCVQCGYRREDRMHIVYEKDFTPYESPAFAFAATGRPPKYGDWTHLELMLEEGDFASYTFREISDDANISITARADKETEAVITVRDKTYTVIIPKSEENVEIHVAVLPKGEDTAVKIMSKGVFTLREVKAE